MTELVVLIPTRRDAEHEVRLDHVLHSLLVQTCRPARVVVRDEGSVGAIENRAVRQFADLLARTGTEVEYRRVPRATGVAAARRDLVAAGGDAELLCFVDDDVCLAPTALAELVAASVRYPELGFAQGQKIEADERRTYWNDVNQLHDGSEGEPFPIWFGDAALLLLRRTALSAVNWDVVTRYELDALAGEDVAITLMIADRHPGYAVPAAVAWHLSPPTERWRWEAASDALQAELLRDHVSAGTLRQALPHLEAYLR